MMAAGGGGGNRARAQAHNQRCVPSSTIVRAFIVQRVETVAKLLGYPCRNGVKRSLVRQEAHCDLVALDWWQTTVNDVNDLAKPAAKRVTNHPLIGVRLWTEEAQHTIKLLWSQGYLLDLQHGRADGGCVNLTHHAPFEGLLENGVPKQRRSRMLVE